MTTPDSLRHVEPFVYEDAGTRSMYFAIEELQSRMRIDQPARLVTDYTRTMTGFLMLHDRPEAIGMIGLGGGSLAKFCHLHLPGSTMTVAEINPHVIALRRQFGVPDDDARLRVVQADGADWVRHAARRFDVLLVDGFDKFGQSPQLCTQAFYRDCRRALRPHGVMVANLHHDDPGYGDIADHVDRAFGGNAAAVASRGRSNSVVFARKGAPIVREALSPGRSLASLGEDARRELRPEFERITWEMRPLMP